MPELPIEQGGFRTARGTRDHIANTRLTMQRAREQHQDSYMFMCFIAYKKAFDGVDHERMRIIKIVICLCVSLPIRRRSTV